MTKSNDCVNTLNTVERDLSIHQFPPPRPVASAMFRANDNLAQLFITIIVVPPPLSHCRQILYFIYSYIYSLQLQSTYYAYDLCIELLSYSSSDHTHLCWCVCVYWVFWIVPSNCVHAHMSHESSEWVNMQIRSV